MDTYVTAQQTIIGKIAKSNTHVDYVCQIFNPGESDVTPRPDEYGFGTFVSVALEDALGETQGQLIGVIYNTLLMNPEFGSLGPRLSPRNELEVFAPDYLQETATLVGIITLGWVDASGHVRQGVPGLAATVGAPVRRLDGEELRRFHNNGGKGLRLGYVSVLLGQNNPLVPHLLMEIIDRLTELFPAQAGQLAVMRNNVAWKSIVQPAG